MTPSAACGSGDRDRVQARRGADQPVADLCAAAERQSAAIDLAERINAVREVLDTGVGSTVELAFDIDKDVWPVTVDIAGIRNGADQPRHQRARRHAGGGTIRIGAHNARLAEGPIPANMSRSPWRDSGTGIAPDSLEKFSTLSSRPSRRQGYRPRPFPGPRFRPSSRRTVKVKANSAREPVTILLPRELPAR